MLSWRVVLPAIAISAACLYSVLKQKDENNIEDVEKSIISAWNHIIQRPAKRFDRISIGVNANVDLIVPGVKVLEALGLKPGKATDLQVISSPQELQEAFTYYFARGAAVERPYSDAKSYKDVVDKAAGLQNSSWYIGGNAALMAQNIVTRFDDCQVELLGPVGPRLQQLLNPAIQVPLSGLAAEDEVHLILEYALGDTWGPHTAPVATRFITSYDEANSKVVSLESFFSSVGDFQPDLVVCTGLHMLESQPPEVWAQRVPVFLQGLRSLPPSLPVHLELASMVNTQFVSTLLTETLFHVTSLGLNEQELSFASTSLGGPHHDVIAQGQPEIHKVTDIMTWLLKTFGKSAENPDSKLTRIHFHSLTFHIMATAPAHWANVEAAVAAGANVAGQKACDVLVVGSEQFELKIPATFKLSSDHQEIEFDPSQPVIGWDMGEFRFTFSPVLVCRNPLKTVGLGDAISAVGLLYSHYLSS